MVIDTHVHFWKYNKVRDTWLTDDMKILQQDYLPQAIETTLEENSVDGCVAVQAAQSELETDFLVQLAKNHSFIKGIVGWVDLQNDNINERLQHYTQYPVIKGWRHAVQAEPDDFLLRANFQRGIRALQPFNYTYDILVYHHQLKSVAEFLSIFVNQKMIIDHCAKPGIGNKKINDWGKLMREIAEHKNVYCKLSGLLTEATWKKWAPLEFYPYLDILFDAFGTERLLFGSDWPVLFLSGNYHQWKSLLENYLKTTSAVDKKRIFGKNAVQFYSL